LVVNSLGTFDISAASAPVTLSSVSGSGSFALGSNKLYMGTDNNDVTLQGTISGSGGSFIKNGTGTLTLLGANTFDGGLLINSGGVVVGDSSALGAGSVTFMSGSLSITGGPLAVDITGNYVQNAGATLHLSMNSAYPVDQLIVTGAAHLGGTLELSTYSSYDPTPGDAFVMIQTTGGVSGRFDLVEGSFTDARILPVYYPKQVIAVAVVPSFAALAVTSNQKSVATALDGIFFNAPSQDLIAALGLQTTGSLPASYDLIAPTGILPAFQMAFSGAQAQASMLTHRFSGLDQEGTSSASKWTQGDILFAGNLPAQQEKEMVSSLSSGDGWSLFVERQSVSSNVSGDSNAPGYQYTSSGLTAGFDRRLARDLSMGLLLSYGQGDTAPGGNSSVNMTGGQAGVYGVWHDQGAYVETSAGAGIDRYQTQRQGYGGYVAGSTGGYQLTGQLGVGFDQKMGAAKLGFFGTGQCTYVSVDGFTEMGSLAPLTYAAQGETSVLSDLGVKASRRFVLGDLTFDPGLSLAWEHRYDGTSDQLTAGFAGGGSFTTTGPQTWSDAVVVGPRLDVRCARDLDLSFQFLDLMALGNGGSQSFSGGMDFGF
jgi:autotransporter-associated beta strand protein